MYSKCCICLENIKILDLFKLSCNHKFHRECVTRLIKNKHNNCPYCRKEISDLDTESLYVCILCQKVIDRKMFLSSIDKTFKLMNPNIEINNELCCFCLEEIDKIIELFKFFEDYNILFSENYIICSNRNEKMTQKIIHFRKLFAKGLLVFIDYLKNNDLKSITGKLLCLNNFKLCLHVELAHFKDDYEYMNFIEKINNLKIDDYDDFFQDYTQLFIELNSFKIHSNFCLNMEIEKLVNLVKQYENYVILNALISYAEKKLLKNQFVLKNTFRPEIKLCDLKYQLVKVKNLYESCFNFLSYPKMLFESI